MPEVDVRTSEDAVRFFVDVPGLKQEDLEVTVEHGVLTITGERKFAVGPDERVVLGRSYGSFTRSFALPDYVDTAHLSADLADGVLTIHIPKQPKAKPRRIPIVGAGGEHKQLGERTE